MKNEWDALFTGAGFVMFECVICEREIQGYPHENGRERQINPICRLCEQHYGRGHPIRVGSFMDRRNAKRLSAIAEALNSTAHIMDWERRHGYTRL